MLQEAGGDVRVAESFAKAMDEGGQHQWDGVRFIWDNLVVKVHQAVRAFMPNRRALPVLLSQCREERK